MLHPALDFPPLAEKPCGADGLTGAQQVAYARRGYLRTVGCADRVHSRHVEALTPSEVGQHLRRAAASVTEAEIVADDHVPYPEAAAQHRPGERDRKSVV